MFTPLNVYTYTYMFAWPSVDVTSWYYSCLIYSWNNPVLLVGGIWLIRQPSCNLYGHLDTGRLIVTSLGMRYRFNCD